MLAVGHGGPGVRCLLDVRLAFSTVVMTLNNIGCLSSTHRIGYTVVVPLEIYLR